MDSFAHRDQTVNNDRDRASTTATTKLRDQDEQMNSSTDGARDSDSLAGKKVQKGNETRGAEGPGNEEPCPTLLRCLAQTLGILMLLLALCYLLLGPGYTLLTKSHNAISQTVLRDGDPVFTLDERSPDMLEQLAQNMRDVKNDLELSMHQNKAEIGNLEAAVQYLSDRQDKEESRNQARADECRRNQEEIRQDIGVLSQSVGDLKQESRRAKRKNHHLRIHDPQVIPNLSSLHVDFARIFDDLVELHNCLNVDQGTLQLGIELPGAIHPDQLTIDRPAYSNDLYSWLTPRETYVWALVEGDENKEKKRQYDQYYSSPELDLHRPRYFDGQVTDGTEFIYLGRLVYNVRSEIGPQSVILSRWVLDHDMSFRKLVYVMEAAQGDDRITLCQLALYGRTVEE